MHFIRLMNYVYMFGGQSVAQGTQGITVDITNPVLSRLSFPHFCSLCSLLAQCCKLNNSWWCQAAWLLTEIQDNCWIGSEKWGGIQAPEQANKMLPALFLKVYSLTKPDFVLWSSWFFGFSVVVLVLLLLLLFRRGDIVIGSVWKWRLGSLVCLYGWLLYGTENPWSLSLGREAAARSSSNTEPDLLGAGGCSWYCLWIQSPFTGEIFQYLGSFFTFCMWSRCFRELCRKKMSRANPKGPASSAEGHIQAVLEVKLACLSSSCLSACSSPGLGFCSSSFQTKCFLSSL